ncbi:MAG: ABC transporter ATP-binding protein [Deltaproteobacteria bacterium]|nr:ABC transporter ATP-binding protein [Deltaproteobacteria bacterium]
MRIELCGIKKVFTHEKRQITVLSDIDITIPAGSTLAVIGVSGSGKSTLLNIIGTLMPPSAGSVLFDGANVFAQSEREMANFRNTKIGFVFQSFNLLPEFSCLENVVLPALIGGKSRREAEEEAKAVLVEVGMEKRFQHRPGEISGGEAQRVAVARALIMNPCILIADEPTGNLDRENGAKIADILVSLSVKRNVSVIIATHNEEIANRASRKVVIIDGRVNNGD